MNKLEKIISKVLPWIALAFILYVLADSFSNGGSGRCRYIPEADDYECWEPR